MKLLEFKGATFLRLRYESNQAKPNGHADLNGQRVAIDFDSTFINLQKTSDFVLRIIQQGINFAQGHLITLRTYSRYCPGIFRIEAN